MLYTTLIMSSLHRVHEIVRMSFCPRVINLKTGGGEGGGRIMLQHLGNFQLFMLVLLNATEHNAQIKLNKFGTLRISQ